MRDLKLLAPFNDLFLNQSTARRKSRRRSSALRLRLVDSRRRGRRLFVRSSLLSAKAKQPETGWWQWIDVVRSTPITPLDLVLINNFVRPSYRNVGRRRLGWFFNESSR